MSARTSWPAGALDRIGAAAELEIAVRRADGSLRAPLPIWVVRVGDQIFVRSWYRRDTGWFGLAVRTGQAHIRVPGVEADVSVEDLGDSDVALRAEIDAAYRRKYGDAGAGSMVTDAAAGTTLRLEKSAGPV